MLQMVYPMFLLIALIMTGGFSDSPPALQLPYNLTPAVRSQVEEDWPKILASCPGFKKYAGDMIFDRIDDKSELGKESGIDIVFKMGYSGIIPVEYRAVGHTCYYGLSQDGRNMRIQKGACAAVCKDSVIEVNGVDYVEAFR
jgi:hypothetical protein